MSDKYPIGTKLLCDVIEGEVIENFKLPGDICVRWDTGIEASYDEMWMDRYTIIMGGDDDDTIDS